jgi:hypothetical protein
MGRVECFELEGIDLRFYSNDHEPSHLHAERPGDWEVRVFFLEDPVRLEVKWPKDGGPDAGDRAPLTSGAASHRPQLLDEWKHKVVAGHQARKTR